MAPAIGGIDAFRVRECGLRRLLVAVDRSRLAEAGQPAVSNLDLDYRGVVLGGARDHLGKFRELQRELLIFLAQLLNPRDGSLNSFV